MLSETYALTRDSGAMALIVALRYCVLLSACLHAPTFTTSANATNGVDFPSQS